MSSYRGAFSRVEQALAEALQTITAVGTRADIEKFAGLLRKKEIVTEMLLNKIEKLEKYGHFREPVSNKLSPWDLLFFPAKNEMNSEWETAKNDQWLFL